MTTTTKPKRGVLSPAVLDRMRAENDWQTLHTIWPRLLRGTRIAIRDMALEELKRSAPLKVVQDQWPGLLPENQTAILNLALESLKRPVPPGAGGSTSYIES